MELALNLVWLLAVAALVCLWQPRHRDAFSSRRFQLAAIVALVVLLFPVISVSDDLQTAQNPAETDTVLRRDHPGVQPHSIFPGIDFLPQPIFHPLWANDPVLVAPLSSAAVFPPALLGADLFNRPPPAA